MSNKPVRYIGVCLGGGPLDWQNQAWDYPSFRVALVPRITMCSLSDDHIQLPDVKTGSYVWHFGLECWWWSGD